MKIGGSAGGIAQQDPTKGSRAVWGSCREHEVAEQLPSQSKRQPGAAAVAREAASPNQPLEAATATAISSSAGAPPTATFAVLLILHRRCSIIHGLNRSRRAAI